MSSASSCSTHSCQRHGTGSDLDDAADDLVAEWRAAGRHLPGFGHRFHPVDPRREPLLRWCREAAAAGVVAGDHLRAGLALERALAKGRPEPCR